MPRSGIPMTRTFRLEFNLDNAAFGEPGSPEENTEIRRILDRVARDIESSGRGSVRDFNGNLVGQWSLLEIHAGD